MQSKSSRRQFVGGAAAASLTALLPESVFSQGPTPQSVVVRPGVEIGIVRPELHSHFAEHLGSCIYGGLWVGKDSPIPNVDGYRKAAIDALKELGIPVLRWPGGCFADNYHWRDGIGPVSKRPQARQHELGQRARRRQLRSARVHRALPPDRRRAVPAV